MDLGSREELPDGFSTWLADAYGALSLRLLPFLSDHRGSVPPK